MTSRSRLAVAAALFALAAGACKDESKPKQTAAGNTSAAGSGGAAAQRGAASRGLPGAPAMPRHPGGVDVDDDPPPVDDTVDGRPWAGRRRGGEPLTPDQEQRMQAKRAERMAMFDANKDGQLDDEERKMMREARVAGMVDHMDTDRDGKLNQAEFDTAMARFQRSALDFATLDKDHDGFLTVEEMTDGMPNRNAGRRSAPTTP